MVLHRDIYWVGRQWAVTGYGVQACDQKQKGRFDIEGARMWEDGVFESVRAQKWLNAEDFEKALCVARKYYPEPHRVIPLVEKPIVSPKEDVSLPEPPKPPAEIFEMRSAGVQAKLVSVWRIRTRG